MLLLFVATLLFSGSYGFAADKPQSNMEKVSPDKVKLRLLKTEQIAGARTLAVDPVSIKPRARITNDGIEFLDSSGKGIKVYKFKKEDTRIAVSRGAGFIGLNKVLQKGDKGEIKEAEFEMVDAGGNLLWKIKNKEYRLIPSPLGQSAIAESNPECAACPLSVYGKDGLIKEIRKPNRGYSVAFSRDNGISAITTNDRGNKKGYLTLFDKAWTELWQKESAENVGTVAVSESAQHIGAIYGATDSSQLWARIYDASGTLVMAQEIAPVGTYQWLFSADGSRALVGSDGNNIYCLDLLARKLLWHYKTKLTGIFKQRRRVPGQESESVTPMQRQRGMFRTIAATPDLKFIMLADPGYDEMDDYIYLLDGKGQPVLIENMGKGYFHVQDEYPNAPTIGITSDGRQISILSKQGIDNFENPLADIKQGI